jgi:hypothetical protein
MGKRVVETFDLGEYVFEEVEEMLPLEGDRKTVFVPKMTDDVIAQILPNPFPIIFQGLSARYGEDEFRRIETPLSETYRGEALGHILRAFADQHGEEVWDIAGRAMYDLGRQRAQLIQKVINIDPEDARSVGRIFDCEDTLSGIKGCWIETGKKRAVKREFVCPAAGMLCMIPEFCVKVATNWRLAHSTISVSGSRH